MALIGLTKEQNKELRRMHVEEMNALEMIKKMVGNENVYSDKLALVSFIKAQTYLELGDFESDPRFPQ